jgi:sortase (surface protein transpeptidase)
MVTGTQVVDSRSFAVDTSNDELLLVTCYPFNSAITGGNERYLVHAQRARII